MEPALGRIFVATKKILSRHYFKNSQQRTTKSLLKQRLFLLRQTKHEVEVNSITIWNFLSRQGMATKKFMLQHGEILKAKSLS